MADASPAASSYSDHGSGELTGADRDAYVNCGTSDFSAAPKHRGLGFRRGSARSGRYECGVAVGGSQAMLLGKHPGHLNAQRHDPRPPRQKADDGTEAEQAGGNEHPAPRQAVAQAAVEGREQDEGRIP